MAFVIDIHQYCGPIELLLHIVRREELQLSDIPLATIVDQYMNYLELLVELSVDDAAEFLEIASLLIEMKSKQAVPISESAVEASDEQPIDELADDLIPRLIEYKRFRDAASILEEQGQRWRLRYRRQAHDLPIRRTEINEQPLEPIEVWDLVSAFGRILRERQPPPTTNVVYDATPIHVHMERIHALVVERKRVELMTLFEAGMHKSTLVAMFLATLELTRHYGLTTEQRDSGHPLYLLAGPDFKYELDVHKIDNLSFDQVTNSNLPVTPR
jgi:segregation and condensation protein A